MGQNNPDFLGQLGALAKKSRLEKNSLAGLKEGAIKMKSKDDYDYWKKIEAKRKKKAVSKQLKD